MNLLNSEASIAKNNQPGVTVINPSAIYNLRMELESIFNAFQDIAQQKGVKLSLSFAAEMTVAYWDLVSLHKHVLNNILSIVLCHTKIGGQIAISIRKSDEYTMNFYISNPNSLSVAENEHALCSDIEFDEANNCNSGLSMAQRYVQAHQGTLVWTQKASELGFEIELPLYRLCLT